MRRKPVRQIAAAGERLYRRMDPSYERERGKFLAIDVGTKKAYLAATPQAALKLAENANPRGSFHLVRLGFDGMYHIASYGGRPVR